MRQNTSFKVPEDKIVEKVINKEMISRVTARSADLSLQFLETVDISKPQYNRLISWFFKFNILSDNSSEWSTKLNDLISTYKKDLEKLTETYHNTEEISKDVPAIIPRDLGRSFQVFEQHLEDLNLKSYTQSHFDNDKFRIHRIFYFLQKNFDGFDYIQGYDRFVYVCVCIALSFCVQIELPDSDSVECFSYHLAKHFISLVSLAHEVLDPEQSRDIMGDLSAFLNVASAPTASAYLSQNLRADMYSLNFLLLLFADQHSPAETLVLWDLIVLHLKSKKEYIYALCVAHLIQIQIGSNTTETLQRILKTKEFNIQRLANDANRFVAKKSVVQVSTEKSGGVPPGIVFITISIIFIVIGIFLFKFLQ